MTSLTMKPSGEVILPAPLRERYGMSEVSRMSRNIGSGVESELPLRQSTGMDYSILEQRMGEYLAKSSGN